MMEVTLVDVKEVNRELRKRYGQGVHVSGVVLSCSTPVREKDRDGKDVLRFVTIGDIATLPICDDDEIVFPNRRVIVDALSKVYPMKKSSELPEEVQKGFDELDMEAMEILAEVEYHKKGVEDVLSLRASADELEEKIEDWFVAGLKCPKCEEKGLKRISFLAVWLDGEILSHWNCPSCGWMSTLEHNHSFVKDDVQLRKFERGVSKGKRGGE